MADPSLTPPHPQLENRPPHSEPISKTPRSCCNSRCYWYTRLCPWIVFFSLAVLLALCQYELPSQLGLPQLRLLQSQLSHYVRWGSSKQTDELGSQSHAKKSSAGHGGNQEPRVAVCIVGGARAFELTGPSIKKYLLQTNNNTDVFLHAPLDKDSYKLSLLKDFPNLVHVRIFTPVRLPETRMYAEVLTSNGSPHGIQGLLQYLNLVEGCLNMIKEHQSKKRFTYDWIIRTRLDGYWNGRLPPLEKLDPTTYTVPSGSQFGGLNDRLGIGNWKTSQVALARLSLLPALHSQGLRGLNSESSFKHQFKVRNVKYKFNSFPFCVLSHRSYAWPPRRYDVPVVSISNKRPLNGAKCRPCTPVATGAATKHILEAQDRSWGWIGSNDELDLCNAKADWEAHWEEIFDRVAEPEFMEVRRRILNQTLSNCILENEEFQKQVEIWDAPSPTTICEKGLAL